MTGIYNLQENGVDLTILLLLSNKQLKAKGIMAQG